MNRVEFKMCVECNRQYLTSVVKNSDGVDIFTPCCSTECYMKWFKRWVKPTKDEG